MNAITKRTTLLHVKLLQSFKNGRKKSRTSEKKKKIYITPPSSGGFPMLCGGRSRQAGILPPRLHGLCLVCKVFPVTVEVL